MIDHSMRFEYSRPVFLEPMTVRLAPATHWRQRCERFSLEIDPPPKGSGDCLDCDNQPAQTLWFEDTLTSLELRARSVVETLNEKPFDYILTEESALRLPASYSAALAEALTPHRRAPEPCAALETLTRDIRAESRDVTTDFLFELTAALHRRIECVAREEGDPWPPATTLGNVSASCRDIAMVFIAACRLAGLAARFVSGYKLELDRPEHAGELHAWAEAFLPGAGWVGYDPSLGLVVADRHIVLAAAHHPELAAPTRGTFRGTGAQSTLTTQVRLTPLASGE
jgi:transglutaminase-like putative cysteine protease